MIKIPQYLIFVPTVVILLFGGCVTYDVPSHFYNGSASKTGLEKLKVVEDEAFLVDVATRSNVLEYVDLAVEEVQGEEHLVRIIEGLNYHRFFSEEDRVNEILQAAVDKISDDKKLEYIYQKSVHWPVKQRAFEKIRDKEFFLKEIFQLKKSGDGVLFRYALQQVTDYKSLFSWTGNFIVLERDDPTVVSDIIQRLKQLIPNEKAFAEWALNRGTERGLEHLVEIIDDHAVLTQLALGDYYTPVRIAAIEKCENQKALKEISLNVNNEDDLRLAAAKELEDQETLEKIALGQCSNEMFQVVIDKISDQKFLRDFALSKVRVKVKAMAVKRLADQQLLFKFATCSENGGYKELGVIDGYNLWLLEAAAISAMTDQDLLVQLLLKKPVDNFWEILPKIDDDLLCKTVREILITHKCGEASWGALQQPKPTPLNHNIDLLLDCAPLHLFEEYDPHSVLLYLRAVREINGPGRLSFFRKFIDVFYFLNDPKIKPFTGEIVSFKARAISDSRLYKNGNSASGYIYTCEITLEKLPTPISDKWKPSFPYAIGEPEFAETKLWMNNLLDPVLNELPLDLLSELADRTEEKNYYLNLAIRACIERRNKQMPAINSGS